MTMNTNVCVLGINWRSGPEIAIIQLRKEGGGVI